MKNFNAKLTGPMKIFLISVMLIFTGILVSAQSGSPPPPPPEHGNTNNQVPGGGAPIGEGLLLLGLFASGYGGFKFRQYSRKSSRN